MVLGPSDDNDDGDDGGGGGGGGGVHKSTQTGGCLNKMLPSVTQRMRGMSWSMTTIDHHQHPHHDHGDHHHHHDDGHQHVHHRHHNEVFPRWTFRGSTTWCS